MPLVHAQHLSAHVHTVMTTEIGTMARSPGRWGRGRCRLWWSPKHGSPHWRVRGTRPRECQKRLLCARPSTPDNPSQVQAMSRGTCSSKAWAPRPDLATRGLGDINLCLLQSRLPSSPKWANPESQGPRAHVAPGCGYKKECLP